MRSDDIYLTLLLQFSLISLMAIGGANTTVPEIHRQAVELHQWVSDRNFSELFAIAQASPGPNLLLVTLVGNQVAGVPGALVATFAIVAPASVCTYFAARMLDRFKENAWRNIVQAGLVAVTIGVVAASALIVARGADRDWKTLLITAATFAAAYKTRVTPLLPLGLAAAFGLAGLL
jgi:chromate transporter